MTLAELTQLLGGIGVIASLIYIAIQIRNNARAVRASTYHQISNSFVSQWDSMAINGEACSVVHRGCDDIANLADDVELTRFHFYMMAAMRRFENAWFQHKVGVLKEADWQAVAFDMDSIFSYPVHGCVGGYREPLKRGFSCPS
jgi:hypothetical protein